MKYILNIEQIRKADASAIEELGIPGIVLMENAARGASDTIKRIIKRDGIKNPRLTFFCGSGNNGGDGFAVARHFIGFAQVFVYWIGSESKMSEETKINFESLQKSNIPMLNITNEKQIENLIFDTDIIIDALIGVGGNEDLRGIVVPLLNRINLEQSMKISIDTPSGLNNDTGIAHLDCFAADYTISMFAPKLGMFLNHGTGVSGKIIKAYLGAPEELVERFCNTFILEKNDFRKIVPKRKRLSSKFDYGKVLFIAGSEKYPGAASLAANAAINSGSGLVYLASNAFHNAIVPEVIPIKLEGNSNGFIAFSNLELLKNRIDKTDSIAIGCGLGDEEESLKLATELITYACENNKRILIDADAIKAINLETKLNKNVVITPHVGEFSRLTGLDRNEITLSSYYLANEYSKLLNCNILLKNVPTIITDGENTFLNIGGNPGMATGGSGDVLSGIIASLMARDIDMLHAIALGAYLHSKSGDFYTAHFSEESLTATKLIKCMSYVLGNYEI
jgi:ADP-dependent NAD(P)H-hydrate dehydratase / NAD(P)H-hydrate epimerase